MWTQNTIFANYENIFCFESTIRAVPGLSSRRSLVTEVQDRSQARSCGILGGQSHIQIGFTPHTSVFPCQDHFTNSPYTHCIHPP